MDHNATTPLCAEALQAMDSFVTSPGNASSPHAWGRRARVALDEVRSQIKALVGSKHSDVIFTSGGTESDYLALHALADIAKLSGRKRIVIAPMEHPAVHGAAKQLEAQGFELKYGAVLPSGEVDVDSIRAFCDDQLAVVSVMLANNETGVIQPVREIATIAKNCGAMVHCDGVQAVGKIALNFDELFVDSFALSAHKFGGPKGIGALVLAKGTTLRPLWSGGRQEEGFRPGSEGTALVLGMGAAAEVALKHLNSDTEKTAIRDYFEASLSQFAAISVVGEKADRLPTTSTVCFHGLLSHRIIKELDDLGVCVSGGAACHSGEPAPSATMLSLGMSAADAKATVRFSFGPQSSLKDADAALERLRSIFGGEASLS